MIIGIVAISKNYAIGKSGKLPWHYSEDLKFFKRTTSGHAVLMGWNTWESIGKPLPNRTNIILTRSHEIEDQPDIKIARSKSDAIALAEDLDTDLFIIGGARVFESFADVIEKWYVTEIPIVVEDADTFMPQDFLEGFRAIDDIELGDDLRVRVFQRK
jgi:dihydrofolate reductase